MNISTNKPHRTAIALSDRGVSLESEEFAMDFYADFPDAVELIAGLDQQIPSASEAKVMEAFEEASRLRHMSLGEALVEHWLDTRRLGRFYPTDVLGVIGLAMIRHPDLLPATQSLINDVERHRRGNPPAGMAELIAPLEAMHFRRMLAALRFNFAEDLWREGQYLKALQNVEASERELDAEAEVWRVLDRKIAKVFLLNECGREEESKALAQDINKRFSHNDIEVSAKKWAPQMPNLINLLEQPQP